MRRWFEYMDTYHRNPSKHRVEDHLLLNWMKHQRKLMNNGELKPERVAAFKRLLAKSESLKRVNQWEVAVEEIMKNDALRNYQQEMIDRLEEAWKQYRSVMVQMPTGTGKTVLMAEAIRREKGIVKSEKFLSAATLSESVPSGYRPDSGGGA